MGNNVASRRRFGGGVLARPGCGVAAAIGFAAAATAFAPSAASAPYPPDAPCAVSATTSYSSSARVGFALSGRGFSPGEDVSVWLGRPDVRAATVAARPDGSVQTVLTVSRQVADTTETLTATSATASCTVPRPTVPAPGTGSGSPTDGATAPPVGPGSAQSPAQGPAERPTAGPAQNSSPRPGAGASTGAPSTPADRTLSFGPPRTVPPRAGDTRDTTTVIGLSPWLIGGISAGLLVVGLLATRLLTRRSG